MKRIFSIFFFMLLIACSSKNKIPPDILPLDKMKFIMWDLMKAGELAAQDTVRNKAINYKNLSLDFYQQIFSIHHITKNDFDKSYDFYLKHPDINSILIDSATAVGNREKSKFYMHKYSTPK